MELFSIALSAPVLPSTILLCVLLCWATLVVLGAIDFHHMLHLPDHSSDLDVPHLDAPSADVPGLDSPDLNSPEIHAEVTADHPLQADHNGFQDAITASKGGVSVLALRWLNLSGIPLILWICIFSVSWWTISSLFWTLVDQRLSSEPGVPLASLLIVRSLILAALVTKVVTKPISKAFREGVEHTAPQNLIGKECTISSSEATPEFGLVKFPTGGAPLLLNVRTDGQHLPKGTPVWITHYDSKRRVYIVSPTTTKH